MHIPRNHRMGTRFQARYDKLPAEIKPLANFCISLLLKNPGHHSLNLKRARKYWAMRIGDDYRALGLPIKSNVVMWIWIGRHDVYLRILRRRASRR